MTETETLRVQVAMLREALNDATDAIDAVESEPGAGSIFKLDWTKALKALKDTADAEKWLNERRLAAVTEFAAGVEDGLVKRFASQEALNDRIGVALATRDAAVRAKAFEEALAVAVGHVAKWLDLANDDVLPGDRHQHRAQSATASDVARDLRALANERREPT